MEIKRAEKIIKNEGNFRNHRKHDGIEDMPLTM